MQKVVLVNHAVEIQIKHTYKQNNRTPTGTYEIVIVPNLNTHKK